MSHEVSLTQSRDFSELCINATLNNSPQQENL